MRRCTAPGEAARKLEHLKHFARCQSRKLFRLRTAVKAQRAGMNDDSVQRRGIMWRENTVREAYIGKVAARRFTPGVDRDRAAAQCESVTRGRILDWSC